MVATMGHPFDVTHETRVRQAEPVDNLADHFSRAPPVIHHKGINAYSNVDILVANRTSYECT